MEQFTAKWGNVGIGTLVPYAKLDVVGEIRSFATSLGQTDYGTSSRNYTNFSSNSHGNVIISSNLYFSNNSVLKIAQTHGTMCGGAIVLPGNGQSNQGKMLFYTSTPHAVIADELYSGSLSMEIDGNGNVGIGKTNPLNKLDVNGTIHSKEVRVDMDNWSDFVFQKRIFITKFRRSRKAYSRKRSFAKYSK